MTGSMAIDIAQKALSKFGLFGGDLGADVILALENDGDERFVVGNEMVVCVADGTVTIVPVNPHGF